MACFPTLQEKHLKILSLLPDKQRPFIEFIEQTNCHRTSFSRRLKNHWTVSINSICPLHRKLIKLETEQHAQQTDDPNTLRYPSWVLEPTSIKQIGILMGFGARKPNKMWIPGESVMERECWESESCEQGLPLQRRGRLGNRIREPPLIQLLLLVTQFQIQETV